MVASSGDEAVRWLVCGAGAGLAVDLGLYPLDTIKTRLQSEAGFRAAGGFRNIYSGMGSVAIGSAPGAAIFFLAYRSLNKAFGSESSLTHAFSASLAEVAACAVRVPTELIKQRSQAASKLKITRICGEIFHAHGVSGFYRGYLSTVAREVPFSMIEFPLWEYLKVKYGEHKSSPLLPLEGAACGSLAGSVAAAVTTPLDVAKTRIMLSREKTTPGIVRTLGQVFSEGGIRALYAGVTPRVLWMSAGGFVFFGAYESLLVLSYWFIS